jgi:hypothetical protein
MSETLTLAVVFQSIHDKKRLGLGTENLKKIWHRFHPVAHLWAALDYRRLRLSDLATLSDVDLNSFLQSAEGIRRLGIRRAWPSHSRGQILPRETSIQVSLKGVRLRKVTQLDVRLVCGADGLPILDMLGRRQYKET